MRSAAIPFRTTRRTCSPRARTPASAFHFRTPVMLRGGWLRRDWSRRWRAAPLVQASAGAGPTHLHDDPTLSEPREFAGDAVGPRVDDPRDLPCRHRDGTFAQRLQ